MQEAKVGQLSTELWALRDLELEVKQGEVLGIIGLNGSGKSTLLKVLSRITKPTEGRSDIYGRVGSLLEVGAGFHPELTGREDIFLNGAVLGMRKRKIHSKFEEIVEFSGCSQKLDTPVKHNSSGMYVCLAFAVAAHSETEILFVDEVLAVGDAAFQKKRLEKIGDVAHQGRTILFVSHNMAAVDSLCTRTICLQDGKVVIEGSPAEVTSRYLQTWMPRFAEVQHDDIETAPGTDIVRLHSARVRLQGHLSQSRITVQTPIQIEFECWKLDASASLDIFVEVFNEPGINVFTTGQVGEDANPSGPLLSSFEFPGNFTNAGMHWIHLSMMQGGLIIAGHWADLIAFEVHNVPSESRAVYHQEWPGAVRPKLEWETEMIDPVLPGSAIEGLRRSK